MSNETADAKLSFVIERVCGGRAEGWLEWPALGLRTAAVSGPSGEGFLPAGVYRLPRGKLLDKAGDPPYTDAEGNSWMQAAEPQFDTARSRLSIHPDGDAVGTLGSIGLRNINTKGWYDALSARSSGTSLTLEVRHSVDNDYLSLQSVQLSEPFLIRSEETDFIPYWIHNRDIPMRLYFSGQYRAGEVGWTWCYAPGYSNEKKGAYQLMQLLVDAWAVHTPTGARKLIAGEGGGPIAVTESHRDSNFSNPVYRLDFPAPSATVCEDARGNMWRADSYRVELYVNDDHNQDNQTNGDNPATLLVGWPAEG